MLSFQGENILSVNQLDRDCIERIFAVAKKMEPYAKKQKRTNVLEGAILANLFFEPSTRTRVSFGTAFNLLGGQVRETTGMSNSALAKGESLFDTAQVLMHIIGNLLLEWVTFKTKWLFVQERIATHPLAVRHPLRITVKACGHILVERNGIGITIKRYFHFNLALTFQSESPAR